VQHDNEYQTSRVSTLPMVWSLSTSGPAQHHEQPPSVRQAALVHRAPSAGGGVPAGPGQRRHRLRPPGPPYLDLLSPGRPTAPPSM